MNRTQQNHWSMCALLRRRPHAWAQIAGSDAYPSVRGTVRFYQTVLGVVVIAEVDGLPRPSEGCAEPIFGFHIHEGSRCTGNAEDPFGDVGSHYNPHRCPHPYHAGDLPPLFGANGNAFCACLTSRFEVKDVVGRTVIIHSRPDDFTTQPSGNSGIKIACGEIRDGSTKKFH